MFIGITASGRNSYQKLEYLGVDGGQRVGAGIAALHEHRPVLAAARFEHHGDSDLGENLGDALPASASAAGTPARSRAASG
jgi:hypothetical protein